ncbi:MAG TPA: hypothetical protein VHX38_24775 [Pseudonocardiaceae bacterium]|nr:hypothetical protein [Pseudonocardiaceae bacterium]
MNSTRPDQTINPVVGRVAEQRTRAVGEPSSAVGGAADAAPPVRRTVRLDAEYLGAGRPVVPPSAAEAEEEQLIVLPRRWGSVGVLPRLLHRVFRGWLTALRLSALLLAALPGRRG